MNKLAIVHLEAIFSHQNYCIFKGQSDIPYVMKLHDLRHLDHVRRAAVTMARWRSFAIQQTQNKHFLFKSCSKSLMYTL